MKTALRVAFKLITFWVILVYIPTCFVYAVPPSAWWPMGIFAIAFPYIWFLLLLLFVVCLFVQKKMAFFILILLLGGLPVIKNVVAFNRPIPFAAQKTANSLRVMQWNCQGMQNPAATLQFLQQYQPDVICLSEFSDTEGGLIPSSIALLTSKAGYSFYAYRPHYHDATQWGHSTTGNAIFSKYPIRDSGFLPYSGKQFPEGIVWAQISFNGKMVKVVNTHLESMRLSHVRKPGPQPPYLYEDSSMIFYGSKLDKLKHFQAYHVKQAAFLKAFTNTVKSALIVNGDFNSVPSSYVYAQIKGSLQDAFLEKGSGLGRSFHSAQPALRIDYLLHSNDIEVLQWSNFRVVFSDHDPEIMDVIVR